MNIDFPIQNVTVKHSLENIDRLDLPKLDYPGFQVSEKEFYMEVEQVARYLVRNGTEVCIQTIGSADPASVFLFLCGSAFGALLHQQCLLPLHGSSFSYGGKGVVICGKSGVGKSSVVAAFCQNAGKFINDDITPLKILDEQTTIVPIKTRLKLWDDTLDKLSLPYDSLTRIRPLLKKFYFPVNEIFEEEQKLDLIIILNIHNTNEFKIQELSGPEKYYAIRNQIYRKIYLKGMPETEKVYFKQLFALTKYVIVKVVTRPQICSIDDAMNFIRKEIGK